MTKDKTYQFSIPVWLELNVEATTLCREIRIKRILGALYLRPALYFDVGSWEIG